MIYISTPWPKSTRELIVELSKVTVYKINIQKETIFLYISNEQLQIEAKIKCSIASHIIMYIWINPKRWVRYVHWQLQNIAEIKEDWNKCRYSFFLSW